MFEYAVEFLRGLPPWGVLGFVCFITFFENVFPPSPSDMLLVFCGTLIGISVVGFAPMLVFATLGSILGFMSMYGVGKYFGNHILESRKIRFLPLDAVHTAERWFRRYGLWVIVGNRFLSGTRAIISFFAGMANLPLTKTTILSALSAAVWNAILIAAGAAVGKNWMIVEEYLHLYGKIVGGAVVVLLAAWWLKRFVAARKSAESKVQ